MTNLTMYDQLVPILSTTRFKMSMRFVGKVAEHKKPVLLVNMHFIGVLLR